MTGRKRKGKVTAKGIEGPAFMDPRDATDIKTVLPVTIALVLSSALRRRKPMTQTDIKHPFYDTA